MTVQNGSFHESLSSSMTRSFRINKVIFAKQTEYQKVELVDTYDFGITLFLDGRFQTSEKDEFFYHESLVHPAVMSHSNPEKVLIIGGGDGGVLEEVTKYKVVRKIRMVELDGEVVDISRKYLQNVCGKAFDDERVEIEIGDGRQFIESTKEVFDIIILDLTDPLESSKFVYTKEFYVLCKDRLNQGGLLALHNDSPFFYPEAFNVISKTLSMVFSHMQQCITYIPGYMLDFAFAVCSCEPIPTTHENVFKTRFETRDIGDLQFYSPEMHARMFVLPAYARRILDSPCRISTDDAPYVIGIT